MLDQNYSTNAEDSAKKNSRLFFLTVLILVVFVIYALRLFTLQVVQGQTYLSQSQRISSTVTTIPAQRGEIFDRNANMPLVINIDSFAVNLIPGEIPAGHYDTVAMKLAGYLGITKSEIDARVPQNRRRAFTSIEIKSNVPFSVISNIAENRTDLPGVSWRNKPVRNYVETGSISHILGYVGNITSEELNVMYNRGYTSNSIVGKTGIEKQYDELLQGKEGRESRTVDVRGRIIDSTPVVTPPVSGKNIVLTLDTSIQHLAEKALGERVGAAVVLKPSSGEILAMVSYPFFDANIFSTDNAAQEYTRLAKSKNNPLLNRAINAAYPPASTFKTIMSTALLAEDAFPSDKKVECTGRLEFGGRTFRCHIGVPGHGWLDMKNAMAQSCDIYFWEVGRQQLGVDLISSYAREFGFGKSLLIDLPAQSEGFVPTASWKERRLHEKWMGGDTMNMSIGQGYITVTPLHVANMMAMVCNSGKVYKPHFLKEVRNGATGDVEQETRPQLMLESSIAPEVWKEVQESLRYVITDGTAVYPMHNRTVRIAGKTGTAEVAGVGKDHWHSWMAAYAPYDAPPEEQVVVVTLVEAVNDWEWWAPYATNIIIQGIFNDQTYEEAIEALGFKYLTQQRGRRE
ncbi:MAG: penicillin-binding protein 2 [Treponema sp.]|nr:penicillin-binding protein 2 [Treponema sp.]